MKHFVRVLLFLVFASGAAQASLIDRGGGFIYDDVLGITWTQNASINVFDTWDNQMAWADSLSIYDSVRNVTHDDWRLASMDVNGDDSIVDCRSTTEVACRDNELGYMYSQNGIKEESQGPFMNVHASGYWSGTEGAPNTDFAWYFYYTNGNQFDNFKFFFLGAWAVRDGDVVAVVPVPAAVWLFGSALGLLGWMRRKTS